MHINNTLYSTFSVRHLTRSNRTSTTSAPIPPFTMLLSSFWSTHPFLISGFIARGTATALAARDRTFYTEDWYLKHVPKDAGRFSEHCNEFGFDPKTCVLTAKCGDNAHSSSLNLNKCFWYHKVDKNANYGLGWQVDWNEKGEDRHGQVDRLIKRGTEDHIAHAWLIGNDIGSRTSATPALSHSGTRRRTNTIRWYCGPTAPLQTMPIKRTTSQQVTVSTWVRRSHSYGVTIRLIFFVQMNILASAAKEI